MQSHPVCFLRQHKYAFLDSFFEGPKGGRTSYVRERTLLTHPSLSRVLDRLETRHFFVVVPLLDDIYFRCSDAERVRIYLQRHADKWLTNKELVEACQVSATTVRAVTSNYGWRDQVNRRGTPPKRVEFQWDCCLRPGEIGEGMVGFYELIPAFLEELEATGTQDFPWDISFPEDPNDPWWTSKEAKGTFDDLVTRLKARCPEGWQFGNINGHWEVYRKDPPKSPAKPIYEGVQADIDALEKELQEKRALLARLKKENL